MGVGGCRGSRRLVGIGGQPLDLHSAMQAPLFIPDSMEALEALERLRETRTHIALVIDEYGGLEGLVTTNDLLKAIVGDISSAHEPDIIQREDGSWLLDGMLPVDEFEQILGRMSIPAQERGDYQTLAGFILRRLGHIPTTGEEFEWGRLRFEILDMDKYRIDRVLMRPRRMHNAPTTMKRRSERKAS